MSFSCKEQKKSFEKLKRLLHICPEQRMQQDILQFVSELEHNICSRMLLVVCVYSAHKPSIKYKIHSFPQIHACLKTNRAFQCLPSKTQLQLCQVIIYQK
ncbi:hypothetical protein JD844_027127 [Phrynosoma platyrhinos]|uniref:Uncharacterized protein n=1 Tax=Phrynosoma platyrhinos TaxID=52577 RepID=A0ABQ7SFV1_PHRPL|nr:hypothetical protein JD844_027127 [Phrynosoma platyrhinos]